MTPERGKKFESTPKKEKSFKEKGLKEKIERVKSMGKTIGEDMDMDVVIGDRRGWRYNFTEDRIEVDPEDVKEKDIEYCFGVIAHEGAHKKISRINFIPDKIHNQDGFHFLLNAVEDPRVNNWVSDKYDGAKKWIENMYNEDLAAEKNIEDIAKKKVGYLPKHIQYGLEVIKDWHLGNFSEDLDSQVREVLEDTVDYCKMAYNSLPDTENPTEEEIEEKAVKMYKVIYSAVWDKYKKLVEKSKEDEKQRQKMKEMAEEGDMEIPDEAKASPEDLPEDLQEDLQEQIEEQLGEQEGEWGSEEIAEEITDQMEDGEGKKEGEEGQEKAEAGGGKKVEGENEESEEIQEEKDKEKKEGSEEDYDGQKEGDEDGFETGQEGGESPHSPLDEMTEEQKEGLKKKLKEKLEEETRADKSDKQKAEEIAESVMEELEQEAQDNREPLPPSELPEDLKEKIKKELEEKLEEMSDEEREKLEERAKEKAEQELKELEEEENKMLEGELSEQEGKRREEEKKKEREKKREKKREELEEKLEEVEKEFEKKKTEYDKTYEDVASHIDRVGEDIMNVLLQKRWPEYKTKFPGQRLRLEGARKYAARDDYTELFETRAEKEKKKYEITLLVDLSGSMSGDKIEETFKGTVLFTEALDRVSGVIDGLDVSVYGFQDVLLEYKKTDQLLDDDLRDKMSVMKKEVTDKGKHNKSSYNNDGYCLNEVFKKLEEDRKKENIIFVLSDGRPEGDNTHHIEDYDSSSEEKELRHVVEKISKEQNTSILGIGLGPGTSHVEDFYSDDFEGVQNIANVDVDKLTEVLEEKLEELIDLGS